MQDALFVCTTTFPGLPCPLQIFEPRYRLMLRRCVESGRYRFGMVPPVPGCQYGTMLEILSVNLQPDGRSIIQTMGSYRFKILKQGVRDGYSIGKTLRLSDSDPMSGPAPSSASTAINDLAVQPPASNSADSDSSSSMVIIDPFANISSPSSPTPVENMELNKNDNGYADAGDSRTVEDLSDFCREWLQSICRSHSRIITQAVSAIGEIPEDTHQLAYWISSVSLILSGYSAVNSFHDSDTSN